MRRALTIQALLLAGIALATQAVRSAAHHLPNPEQLAAWMPAGPNRVYDRAGHLIGTVTAFPTDATPHQALPLNDVSPFLVDAVITSEDRRFFEHGAVDLGGLGRALLSSATGRVQGGSTLTQQLVKNTLLRHLQGARTIERKLKEALLAQQVEARYTKREILSAYLNIVYWGSGGPADLIGPQDAARAYFGKDAANLTLAESVYLATLVPSPRRYFEYRTYRPLMRSLLARMVEDGRITAAQAAAAWRAPLQPAGWRVRYDANGNVTSATLMNQHAKRRNFVAARAAPHPHFLQAVQREALRRVGRDALARGGLNVYTTLDPQAQAASERASRLADIPDGATLGLALVDPATGQVLALVGQKLTDAPPADWDNATRARRQVGSSAKPFLYTLALERGFTQVDRVLDAPLSGPYQPQNYDRHFLNEPVTLRYALNHSLNLPTVRLAQQVGVPALRAKLQTLGLRTPPGAGLSLAIGTVEASPLQLASAYATFANGGVWTEPTFIARVTNVHGQTLPLPAPAQRRVWSAQTAFLGLDMLRGVVNDLGADGGGLAWRARILGWDVAGKTGTTNDVRDLWFAGVTPGVAGAVWVGRQAGGSLPQNAYSGDVATPIWQSAVAGTVAGRPPLMFEAPRGAVQVWAQGHPVGFLADGDDLHPVGAPVAHVRPASHEDRPAGH
ncbi:transglycosylase domain-containing protein [Deinococcus maricopensis]|uniref:peptidoglycan glycosyltransferase n=1 Tax=Deinococcus maricopensis (strain DSM 21211 / LMG 22137 / NRRL B-23946 / LB-34) TaxID=709986 RepID=E8U4A6_DEIML|nr:transglycosylase domain-containing protein [Deinococcus maricopensis]ADV65943.1 glycosyl transferase family 51 [Deinococcus maricopensis DSM 21211]